MATATIDLGSRSNFIAAAEAMGRATDESRRVEGNLARRALQASHGDSCVARDLYWQQCFADLVDLVAGNQEDGAGEQDQDAGARPFEDRLADLLDFGQVARATTETTVTCRACGSTDVRCEARQTRSADEAPTLFFDCQCCHKRWRVYC